MLIRTANRRIYMRETLSKISRSGPVAGTTGEIPEFPFRLGCPLAGGFVTTTAGTSGLSA
ncbi:hypothetical protein [Streptosporangium sp. NPDC000396]|uniref:hypothetical protein n=1 Tax=Streptosporangium sp. NPDC000396 TaxID=3366185 RepID=UPI00369A076B